MASYNTTDSEKAKQRCRDLIVKSFNEVQCSDNNLKIGQIFSLPGRWAHCCNTFKDGIYNANEARFVGLERFRRVYENMTMENRKIFGEVDYSKKVDHLNPKNINYHVNTLSSFIYKIDPDTYGYRFDLSFLDMISNPKENMYNQIGDFSGKFCSNTTILAICFLMSPRRTKKDDRQYNSDIHDKELICRFEEHYFNVESLLKDNDDRSYQNTLKSTVMYFNIFKLSGKKS